MDKILLIGAINSCGVPYSRDNKDHLSFLDIVSNELKKASFQVEKLDLYSLDKNNSWNFSKIFTDSIDYATIKNIQIQSIENLQQKNFIFSCTIPKKVCQRYSINDEDKSLIIKKKYCEANIPVFIYSGGINDWFVSIQAGPVEMISKGVREKLPENIMSLIKEAIENVRKNLELLIRLNPKVTIYVLGIYDTPLFSMIEKIAYFQDGRLNYNYRDWINYYNFLLQEVCNSLVNVEYISLEQIQSYVPIFDFHPNRKGHEQIAYQLLKRLNKGGLLWQKKH